MSHYNDFVLYSHYLVIFFNVTENNGMGNITIHQVTIPARISCVCAGYSHQK